MIVRIRKTENQIKDSDTIKVEALLVGVSPDIDFCAWTFRSNNPDVLLTHSGNANEESLLSYYSPDNPSGKFNPVMEIQIPDNDTHIIQVIAETTTFVDKEISVMKIDDEGSPYEVREIHRVSEKTRTVSEPLAIRKFTDAEGWV